MTILKNEPLAQSFKSNKKFNTRIHLIDKHTGKVFKKKYFTDPQFAFHILNCYEINDAKEQLKAIQIDLCSYDIDGFHIEDFTFDNMFSGKRYEII